MIEREIRLEAAAVRLAAAASAPHPWLRELAERKRQELLLRLVDLGSSTGVVR